MRRKVPVKVAAAVLSAAMVMSGLPATAGIAAEPTAQTEDVTEVVDVAAEQVAEEPSADVLSAESDADTTDNAIEADSVEEEVTDEQGGVTEQSTEIQDTEADAGEELEVYSSEAVTLEADEAEQEQCAAPEYSMDNMPLTPEGFVANTSNSYIQLRNPGSGVNFRYTVNGTDPTSTSGTNLTGNGIRRIQYRQIKNGTQDADGYVTIKIIAYASGKQDSEITEIKLRIPPADVAIFKDVTLKKAVFEALGKEGDAITTPLTQSDVAGLTELKLPNAGITDLAGLQYATGLEVLDLSGNDLSGSFAAYVKTLNAYSYGALKEINLSGCNIVQNETFNTILFRAENLERADLSNNQMVGSFKLNAGKPMSKLTDLNLSGNNLYGIAISGSGTFDSLKKIDMRQNRVFPDENSGSWYASAVDVGLDKFDFSNQKDLTELMSYTVKLDSTKTESFDNVSNTIDLGTTLDDEMTLTLTGYGAYQTMSGKVEGRELPIMIAAPDNNQNCAAAFSLEVGENTFDIPLTHISKDQRTITVKITRNATPSAEAEESAGIRDAQLQKAICSTLNSKAAYKDNPLDPYTYVLKKSDLENLTYLSVSNRVTDLSGLENAVNLTDLRLSKCAVSSIDVSCWPELTWLSLGGDTIRDISGMEKLTKLTLLSLSGAYEKIEGLSGSADTLTSLSLSSSVLKVPADVSALTKLTSISLPVAQNGSVSDLSKNTALTSITYKNITDGFRYEQDVKLPNLNTIMLDGLTGDTKLYLPGIDSDQSVTYRLRASGGGVETVDVSTAKATGKIEIFQSSDADFTFTGSSDKLTAFEIQGSIGVTKFDTNFRAPAMTSMVYGSSGIASEKDLIMESTESFPAMTSLQIWFVSQMKTIPEGIKGMRNLTSLSLWGCESLENLDNLDLTRLDNLKSLAIRGCDHMTGTFDGSTLPVSLTSLTLANNGLESVTGTWPELTNVTSLDLSLNQFREFPTAAVQAVPNATSIQLAGNRYNTIPVDAFDKNVALKNVTIGNYVPGKVSGAMGMSGAPMTEPLDGTDAAKAIAALKERLPDVTVSMYGGGTLFDPTGDFSCLGSLNSSEGAVSANFISDRDLTLRVPAGTASVTLRPIALLDDTTITVNGTEYRSGDDIEIALPGMETEVTITCDNPYSREFKVASGTPEDEATSTVTYTLKVIAASYIENFEPEDAHWYNMEYTLRKSDESVSMANTYFDHIALIKVDESNENGKYEVRFTTTSKDYINDMQYALTDGVYKTADIVAAKGNTATYRIYADNLEDPITIRPRVAPMGDVYVNCWMHLDKTKAIDMTASIGADKAELSKAITDATEIIDKVEETRNIYTSDTYAAMTSALEKAQAIDALESPQQVSIDTAAKTLNDAIEALVIDESKLADKTTLEEALTTAKSLTQGKHTDTNWEALQEAIADAQEVYDDIYATTKEAESAAKYLNNAVKSFNSSGEASTMDPANLEDGVYTAYVDMINASNPDQKSMSDGAITKPVTLTVKNGEYSVTANFHGIYITLAGQSFFGYMKELSYWDGEKYAPVTVDTTYDVVDEFNDTDNDGKADYLYPHQMTFPLVNKDKGDDENGFVHVQVFVPIMESISAGSGTQQALMKIDWTSLQEGDEAASEAIKAEKARNELSEAVADAKNITTSGYTDASVQALTQAISDAEALLKNTDATRAQLESAKQKLDTAVAGLTKKAAAKNEWVKSGNRWWYRHADGSYTTNGWEKIDNVWYYFDGAGWMKTGWVKDGNTWYYLKSSGAMATGWQKVNNVWYYFKASGAMQSGWQKISNVWYYFNASGAMQTGWQKISGKWYYFNTSGAMQTGWLKLGGKWYYCNSSGAMVTGTQTIGGKTYRFDANGVWLS